MRPSLVKPQIELPSKFSPMLSWEVLLSMKRMRDRLEKIIFLLIQFDNSMR